MMWCTMAVQSLRNYIDDRRKGAVASAKGEMADYRGYKTKCLRALKKG